MKENELILTSLLNCRLVDLYIDPPVLNPSQQEHFENILNRRKISEPLQYILGSCEFMGLSFQVDPRVLIPRPETELLVEAVLKKVRAVLPPSVNILDVGTGSGNISVSLAKFLPEANISALDISSEALDLAEHNACRHQVSKRISFIQSDLFENIEKSFSEQNLFDIIVSNPPYIPSDQICKLAVEVQKEPRLALDGGEDGLNFYRAIMHDGIRFLKPGGYLFLEIGDGQREPLEEISRQKNCLEITDVIQDYRGTDRIMALRYRV